MARLSHFSWGFFALSTSLASQVSFATPSTPKSTPITPSSSDAIKYITINGGVYFDPSCQKLKVPILLDPGKPCNSYSYIDSKGVKTSGSVANIRCYKNKVLYDAYPFSSTCSTTAEIIEKNHTLLVKNCSEAKSHEGLVYDKLIGYQYPGNIKCVDTSH